MSALSRFFRRLLGRPEPVRTKPKKPKVEKPKKEKKPPPPDAFVEAAAEYEKHLLTHWSDVKAVQPDARGEIAVLVTPWLGCAVPMMNIELALLVNRAGVASRLILDVTDVAQNADMPAHRDAVRSMANVAARVLSLTDMTAVPAVDGTAEMAVAKRICDNLAIWMERGEGEAEAFFQRNPGVVEKMAAHLARVRHTLAQNKPRRLLIPGGFFGLSAIYCRVAQDLGIPFTTYDSNPKAMLVSKDAIAGHRMDLRSVVERVAASLTDQERAIVNDAAESEFQIRLHGRDPLKLQIGGAEGGGDEGYDILVPLNVRWDAAALDCERTFESCAQWLEALLAWVEKDERFSICLREHPVGRLPGIYSHDDYGPLVKRFASLGARLRLVRADEAVNTYGLIAKSRVVLPLTSTVGVEAAMLGKPVIAHTNCYYRDMGFGWNSSRPDEYFALVQQALEGQLTVTPERRERAALVYYVTQRCSFLAGDFNPNPEPFLRWVKLSPDELLAQTGANEVVQGLIDDEDVPMYLHHRNMNAAIASAA